LTASRSAVSAHELFGVGVAPVDNLASIRDIGDKLSVGFVSGMALGMIGESPRRNADPDAAFRAVQAERLV
jgi:hypothetical protein